MYSAAPVFPLESFKLPALGDSCLFEDPVWRWNVEELYRAFDSAQAVKVCCDFGCTLARLLEAAEAFFEQPYKRRYARAHFNCPPALLNLRRLRYAPAPVQVQRLFWRIWLSEPWSEGGI